MLNIQNLTVQLGEKLLFTNVSAIIHAKDKVGIVGVNGSGKSTLLKTIIGQINPDFGQVTIEGTVGYLSQEIHIDNSFIKSNNDTVEEYLTSQIEVESWEISKFMNLLNIDGKAPDSLISEMSGGQKVKVEIMKMLLMEPDFLILDEPTNFLDIPTTEWLMSYLVKYPKAILVISHDLRLMNKAINKIWYLNEYTKKIEEFLGNYEQFIIKKEESDSALAHRLKLQDMESVRLHKVAIRKKTGVGGKGAIAARIRMKADELKEKTESERIQLKKSAKMNLRFNMKVTPGRKILEIESVSKSYGNNKVLKNINLEISRGDRVVIIGRNGAGKSTLLKILTENTELDSGTFQWGHNVDYGYYSQEFEGIDYSISLLENLEKNRRLEGFTQQDYRKILGGFLFHGEKVFQKVATLSGGEKTRLALSMLFAGGYNTLILDEPTTYLDPQSIDILQGALMSYEGTMIIVSHIPNFVKGLTPNKVLLMPDEEVHNYRDRYLELVGIN